ncbi:purine-nucleoside phosphorylase [bacterium]|nr:purine-nucleoside phosphorylase [FCB group bacterium]MBL7191598.1 purine-nucleoside phosphorylase [bacterium]
MIFRRQYVIPEYAVKAADFLKDKGFLGGKLAIVLGSGLGALAEEAENPRTIDTAEISGYPASSVEGHHGRIVEGRIAGVDTLIFQGRVHYYEGYPPEQTAAPVFLSKAMGIESIIFTNASGAVNPLYRPGDFMLIVDFLNLMFMNPLSGLSRSEVRGGAVNTHSVLYQPYIDAVRQTAIAERIRLHEGVLGVMSGPSYETPAEIRMLRIAGADAVSMSTVPELITASYLDMKTAAVSCITNKAAGISDKPLTHEEVQEISQTAAPKFVKLIEASVKSIGNCIALKKPTVDSRQLKVRDKLTTDIQDK